MKTPKGHRFAPIPVRGHAEVYLKLFNEKEGTKYNSIKQIKRDYNIIEENGAWFIRKIRDDKGLKRGRIWKRFFVNFFIKNRAKIILIELLILGILLIISHSVQEALREAKTKGYLGEVSTNISPVKFYEWELEKIKAKKAYASEPKIEADKEGVESLISKHFGEYADKAIACFRTESGLRPTAFNGKNKNGTWDAGVAQVNQIHCPKLGLTGEVCKQALFDPETNLALAYQIFKGRGYNFSAWYGKGCRAYW